MKKIVWTATIALLLMLAYMNITMFVKANGMTQQINEFAQQTKELRHSNELLEQKLYQSNSLQKTASAAADMEFTAQVSPVYIDGIRMARK